MFGLDKLVDSVTETVSDFVEDPVGKTIETALSPVTNVLDICDGLTEGELRVKAIASLGADVVGGMATAELIEWYTT